MMKSQQNRIELVTRLALDLSHGRSDGRIDTVEGQSYELESIFEQFNNQQCPYLKGKPKFFIIQVRFWIPPCSRNLRGATQIFNDLKQIETES